MLKNARQKALYLELRISALKAMQRMLLLFKDTNNEFYKDIALQLGVLSKEWKKEIDKLST